MGKDEPAPPPGSAHEPSHGESRTRLKEVARPSFSMRLRTYFLTGTVVAAPLAITIYIATSFIGFVDRAVTRWIPGRLDPDTWLPVTVPGLGLLIAAAAVTLLGALTANLFGRTIVGYGERVVARLPVIRTLYTTLKQITETVIAQSATSFRQVGLIEYPSKGSWALVFVTGAAKGDIDARLGEETVSCFLPTTPNPTTGYLLYVPRKDVILLDMTAEDAAKLIISAGLVGPPRVVPTPESEAAPAPRLLDQAPRR